MTYSELLLKNAQQHPELLKAICDAYAALVSEIENSEQFAEQFSIYDDEYCEGMLYEAQQKVDELMENLS